MKETFIGKLLITIVAAYATFGSYIFDWNKTHIYNPNWSPHAKFHNAQTMLLGTCIGLLSLWIIWYQKLDTSNKVRMASILAGLYWITQVGSILFPGTALVDPEFSYPGQPPAQLIVDVVMLTILVTGFLLASRSLKHNLSQRQINKL